MNRTWPWLLVAASAALAACWDFEGAYNACVSSGTCSGGGGDGGGGDGGYSCPAGKPSGNGLCLIDRYDVVQPAYGVFGLSPGFVVFGEDNEGYSTWRSGTLEELYTVYSNYAKLRDLHGVAENDIWAAVESGFVGDSRVYHFDGTSWSDRTVPGFASGACNGVWAEDAGYAFLACDNGVYRATLTTQSQVVGVGTTGVTFSGVWGIPNGPAWAVGGHSTLATIRQRQGATWTSLDFAGQALNAVHGNSERNVWAVGNGGTLLHQDGTGWHPVSSGLASADLADVFVDGTGAAWITAYSNRLMVMDPDGGQSVFYPPGVPTLAGSIFFQRVHVFDSGDVWLTAKTDDGGVYYNGAMFHYRKL